MPGNLATIEYQVEVRVKPCLVTSVTDAPDSVVTHDLGNGALTTDAPLFVQTPACTYPGTNTFVSVPPLPSYIVFNSADGTFTIQDDPSAVAATYDIEVTHTVTFKIDEADLT